MRHMDDADSTAFRRSMHQSGPSESCSVEPNAHHEESVPESVTSNEYTDLQEDELFERFNTDIFPGADPTSYSFPATLQASFLYPNLQAVGHPMAYCPLTVPGLSPLGYEDTGDLPTTPTSPFSTLEPCVSGSALPPPIAYPVFECSTSGKGLSVPLPYQQYFPSLLLPDSNYTTDQNRNQGQSPILSSPSNRSPDCKHKNASISHSQSFQLPHACLQQDLAPLDALPPLLSFSLPVLPPKENHSHSMYPPVIPLRTQANKALSFGEQRTIRFCSSPNVSITNLSVLSPSGLSSYVLELLDSNASVSNTALEKLQATLNATDLVHFEDFYINLYNIIIENLLNLAKSPKGSLLIVDFVKKVGNEDLCFNLLNALFSRVKLLMNNQHSIWLLQSLLDDLPDEQFLYFCSYIEPDCMVYCYHRQANHVVQKVISILESKAFVSERHRETANRISAIILKDPSDFLALSDQVCGCRIYQKLFPLLIDEGELVNIRSVLLEKFVFLCNNQWANFCIQGLIKNKRLIHSSIRKEVVEQLTRNAILFCTHKFGSHVIEKFLECCTVKERIDFSMSLFMNPNFPNLMDDSYGNFIVQKMLHQKESKTDVRLATLRETCGRLCKYYLKRHNFKEQSIKNIMCYLSKSLKGLKGLEPLCPDKVLDIARKLDTSSWVFCA
ncbi:Serine rich pumilio family rna binding domain protein [Giardia duodenalis]|uniref:Serine rich pumilio family rna binding domain protein n=1 Tax=Giardia intestinalis TaxID=5741 RepID=V6TDS5_GIAIN|nr:Serine rich pumilio family rna binding domain protein [Giardia intestinalis]